MKEFYRVIQASKYCNSPLNTADYADLETASKEYKRVVKLGYNASTLQKITILK